MSTKKARDEHVSIESQLRELVRLCSAEVIDVAVSIDAPGVELFARTDAETTIIGTGDTIELAVAGAFRNIAAQEERKLENLQAQINATRDRLTNARLKGEL